MPSIILNGIIRASTREWPFYSFKIFGITPRVAAFLVPPLFSRPENMYRRISIILFSNFRDFPRNLSEGVKLKLR